MEKEIAEARQAAKEAEMRLKEVAGPGEDAYTQGSWEDFIHPGGDRQGQEKEFLQRALQEAHMQIQMHRGSVPVNSMRPGMPANRPGMPSVVDTHGLPVTPTKRTKSLEQSTPLKKPAASSRHATAQGVMPGGDAGQQGSNMLHPFVRTSQGLRPGLAAGILVKRPPDQEGTAGPTRTPKKSPRKTLPGAPCQEQGAGHDPCREACSQEEVPGDWTATYHLLRGRRFGDRDCKRQESRTRDIGVNLQGLTAIVDYKAVVNGMDQLLLLGTLLIARTL